MRTIRAIVFVVFFGVGAAVLAATVLCDDFLEYFHNRSLLKQDEDRQDKLEALNSDYDELLGRLEEDPCELARLAPATLGVEPNEPNTAYPRATVDKLAAARYALSEQAQEQAEDQASPEWLDSCCRWPRWHILFFCGAALILVSFVFFGPPKRSRRSMTLVSKKDDSELPGAKSEKRK